MAELLVSIPSDSGSGVVGRVAFLVWLGLASVALVAEPGSLVFREVL